MRSPRARLLTLLATVFLSAAACSGDGGGSDLDVAPLSDSSDESRSDDGTDQPAAGDADDDQPAGSEDATDPDQAPASGDADGGGADGSGGGPGAGDGTMPTDDAQSNADANEGSLQESDDIRSYEVLDVATGNPTTLNDTVTGDRPVLLWFWAPH